MKKSKKKSGLHKTAPHAARRAGLAVCALAGWAATATGHAQTAAPAQAATPPAATQAAVAPYSAAAHDALIQQARAGTVTPQAAFDTLSGWAGQKLPAAEHGRVVSDAVVYGARAGREREAVQLASTANSADLQDYALLPLVQAARNVGNQDVQGRAIQRMLQLHPKDWEGRFRYVQWLADMRAYDDADRTMKELQGEFGKDPAHRVQLLELHAALADQQGRSPEALRDYRELLALVPNHAYARKRLEALSAPKKPDDAPLPRIAEVAPPAEYSPAQQQAWRTQRDLAERLRWAMQARDDSTGPQRYDQLKALLPRYDALMAQVDAGAQSATGDDAARWQTMRANLAGDRLKVLYEMGQYREVIAQSKQLEQQGVRLTPYGTVTVAAAYAASRDARSAVRLYEQAQRELGSQTLDIDTRTDMVYAYMDAGEFRKADALWRQMERDTPSIMRLSAQPGQFNDEYDTVRSLRVSNYAFTDRPGPAEREASNLVQLAPGSIGYQLGYAKSQQMRSRPQHALDLYRAALTDFPRDRSVRLGYADALFGAGYQAEGRELLDQLQQLYPGDNSVANAVRENDRYRAARLIVDAGVGRDGGTLDSSDRRVDTRLLSPLLGDSWRVFAHHVYGWGAYDQTSARLSGVGLGATYERGPFDALAEVHRAYQGTKNTGVTLEGNYRVTDAIHLHGKVDTASLDMPWRAVGAGITGKRYEAGIGYVPSEARRFDLRGNWGRYSDGNRLHEYGLSWQERWLSLPSVQFGTVVSFARGGNSLQTGPYFAPSSYSLGHVTGRLQWLTWKNSERTFTQVLELGAGRFNQAGYGGKGTYDARYQHEWRLAPYTNFYYGIGWTRTPYDGVLENRRSLFLGLSLPLQ